MIDTHTQPEDNNENGINSEICVLMEFNSTAKNTKKLEYESDLNRQCGGEDNGSVSSGLNQRYLNRIFTLLKLFLQSTFLFESILISLILFY